MCNHLNVPLIYVLVIFNYSYLCFSLKSTISLTLLCEIPAEHWKPVCLSMAALISSTITAPTVRCRSGELVFSIWRESSHCNKPCFRISSEKVERLCLDTFSNQDFILGYLLQKRLDFKYFRYVGCHKKMAAMLEDYSIFVRDQFLLQTDSSSLSFTVGWTLWF